MDAGAADIHSFIYDIYYSEPSMLLIEAVSCTQFFCVQKGALLLW